jgi:pyruvate/2-oxoglutarate dehydrogenase complex dihydrolipoamide dehydrogenase (E3) component
MNTTEASAQSPKDTKLEEFDLVILGGGTGSTIAAWTFAKEGQRVAVVDRKYIGGSCPNIACLPSKNVIHSAKVASYVRSSEDFGIANKAFTVDMAKVRDRKRKMVSGLNDMYLDIYKNTGAQLIFGSGRFIAPRTLEVTLSDGTKRQLRGTNVIISTGTRAALPPVPGLLTPSHSRTWKHSNWTKSPNIFLCSAAATSDWNSLRPCAASAAKCR